jgi:orotidine-5'-phosphate decarboxylase
LSFALLFSERLRRAWQTQNSLLCVGLDPEWNRLPECITAGAIEPEAKARAVAEFSRRIVDAVQPYVCAFKPQYAFYGSLGPAGIRALEDTVRYIRARAPHALVILDAKRADIGNTSRMYAVEAFDVIGADAVTVNPYMGGDALAPFLERADRGVAVLCRTSNPGAAQLQDLWVRTDRGEARLYQVVARLVAEEWNANGNCALVVGATAPAQVAEVRAIAPDVPLLLPGIGAQGGDLAASVAAGLDSSGAGLIVNVSRAVLYASSGEQFAEAAAAAARSFTDQINSYRGVR